MMLKIQREHYNHLESAIADILARHPDAPARYACGDFSRADRVKDLHKRYRWDLLRAAVGPTWICDNLYPYLTDDHIDSALRRIVAPLPVA